MVMVVVGPMVVAAVAEIVPFADRILHLEMFDDMPATVPGTGCGLHRV